MLLKDRVDLFYILGAAPLPLIMYFGYIARQDFFAVLVPMYGFLILLIKRDKLSAFASSGRASRFIGIFLMLASFFMYYALALFYAQAQFYGVANYTIYLIGLFLAFFRISALRESFTTLFLIVAATSSSFIGVALEPYMKSFVPLFAQIIFFILTVLSVPATLVDQNIFLVHTLGGGIQPLSIVPRCIGIDSFLTFAIIIIATMMEEQDKLRTKVLWAVGGVIGTFFVNIIRVSLIFIGTYFYGFNIWSDIHFVIGYILFITWLATFFVVFSKRQAISSKFSSLLARI